MKYPIIKTTFAFFIVVLLFPVSADLLPERLAQALQNTKDTSDSWAYTRETHDEIGHYTERFDPRLPPGEQWQLVAFDNKEPLEEHYEMHRENYDELSGRDSPSAPDFNDMIDPETVELVDETEETIAYTFRPTAEGEDDQKIVPHLTGTIVINKRNDKVAQIDIVNIRKIKPLPIVSIKRLEVKISLEEIQPGGPVFVTSTESLAQGRVMGLKKFSEEERVTFRDFERVE
ncbi:MAG: hypothetical protein AB8G18_16000 [Gammaproteobacteria bacterium]